MPLTHLTDQTRTHPERLGRPWVGELLGRGFPLGGGWLVGESWVWLLWEVEEFFLFGFAGAGFLGGFVGVALVAKYAEVF